MSWSESEIILGEKCEARGKIVDTILTSDEHFAAPPAIAWSEGDWRAGKISLMQLPDIVFKQALRQLDGQISHPRPSKHS